MNILTYTNLFPNNIDETHGIFVERRLRELVRSSDVRAQVVAPVPWFPSKARVFGRYATMAGITRSSEHDGIRVEYPRYPLIPKFGMSLAPYLMAMATRARVRAAIAACGGVALLDAHYFYPDGVAGGLIARSLGLPYVITARGSDINLIARYRLPRTLMLKAAANAAALVAVSKALSAEMIRIGMPAEKIHVLRNGVDLEFFRPSAGVAASGRDTNSPLFLCVGALKQAKGHDIAIRFVAGLSNARLWIAGGGPEEGNLKELAQALGVADRVRFLGILDAAALRECYQAADALILMSEREGMPNVVLESLACGTPVIAANVGGIPEVLNAEASGVLVDERSATALAAAWTTLCSRGTSREAVRRHAEQYSWADTVAELSALMHECARKHPVKTGSVSHKTH